MKKHYFKLFYLLLGFLSLTLIAQHGFAQSGNQNRDEKIKVMVLGTFHFQQSPDYYKIKSIEKQKEIKAIIDSIAQFQPTKIAIEASYKDSSKFDSLYKKYRAGKHQLNTNERQQLGFRLAKRLNHKSLYTIDYQQSWPYGEVMGWAEENDPQFMDFYKNWKKDIHSFQDSLQRHATLEQILRWLNSEDHEKRLKKVRMKRIDLGAGSNFVGTKLISSSYDRNLKIFANLIKHAKWEDRILVIYGSGHNYFLREFVQMHPDTKLVETLGYL